jgi:hypothetical protein
MHVQAMGRRWPPRRWGAALLAPILIAASFGAQSAQKSASFMVQVDLLTDTKTGSCGSTAAQGGSPLLVVNCNTSTPTPQKPDSRFLLNVYQAGYYLGTVDGMMSTGTVTSWRVVSLPKRDYLEIMVGW